MNFLSGFKKVTHAIGVGILAGAGWVLAHPEIVQAIVTQYPKAAVVTTGAGLILALYHVPTK